MAFPFETTPDTSSHLVEQMARMANPGAVAVEVRRAANLLPLGFCYWNVANVVQERGGAPVLGWLITWWPNVYVAAMHHAVWKTPEGNLLDVTEPQPFDKEAKHSLFVIDTRSEIRLEISPCIDNIHLALQDSAAIQRYIDAYRRHQVARREVVGIGFRAGYRNEAAFAAAAGRELPSPIWFPPLWHDHLQYLSACTALEQTDAELKTAIQDLWRLFRPQN